MRHSHRLLALVLAAVLLLAGACARAEEPGQALGKILAGRDYPELPARKLAAIQQHAVGLRHGAAAHLYGHTAELRHRPA